MSDLEQVGPHQGFGAGQVEPFAGGCIDHGGQVILGHGGDSQVDAGGGCITDLLDGGAVPLREHGAQALVPLNDVVECPAQRVPIEGAAQPERPGHVVGGRAALQTVEEPQPLLRERRRHQLALGTPLAHQRRPHHPRCLIQRRGDPSHSRGLEHCQQRQFYAQHRADLGDQAHR